MQLAARKNTLFHAPARAPAPAPAGAPSFLKRHQQVIAVRAGNGGKSTTDGGNHHLLPWDIEPLIIDYRVA
jgi:hypothetical protein